MASQSTLLDDPSGCPELSYLSINVFYVQKNTDIKSCRSNCRSVDVDILYPTSYLLDNNSSEHPSTDRSLEESMEQAKNHSLSPKDTLKPFDHSSHELSSLINNCSLTRDKSFFPFLSLPIEIRLKIYLLLLPPRHHKVTTQVPHNGYYFPPTSIPIFSAQSFYPISPDRPDKLTTYKVLTANSHIDHPNPSIHTRILSVCKQTKQEAEEVLYGNVDSIWDFGMNIDAIKPFWLDRSPSARGWVRNLRIARESLRPTICTPRDVVWEDVCKLMINELRGLRTLDLTTWTDAAVSNHLPRFDLSEISEAPPSSGEHEARRISTEKSSTLNLHEWKFTERLLEHEGLRSAKITWWEFKEAAKVFLVKWMLESCLLTEEMIKEGEVVQGVVVWNGNKA